jgi:phosphatidylserine/phosphatidylglycerophosphate/cardiolipin synthase-like enzyme
MKRKASNLNATVKRTKVAFESPMVEVWVDGIPARIVRELKRCDTALCCLAWLTHKDLLKALRELDSVRVVVTKDKMLKRYTKVYKTLPTQDKDKVAVRALGSSRKGYSMMHNKFCIGMRKGVPLFVLTGSFNWSASATRALENVVCLRDPGVVEFYKNEHAVVWKASNKFY